MRLPRQPARPVRAVQLDPEDDAALLRYCDARGLSLSEAMRELLGAALRASGAGGLSAGARLRREAVREAKRSLLDAIARAEDVTPRRR